MKLYWYVGDTTGKKVGHNGEARSSRRFFIHDPDEAGFNGRI